MNSWNRGFSVASIMLSLPSYTSPLVPFSVTVSPSLNMRPLAFIVRPDDAALAPSARDQRRVARHAAPRRQDADRRAHALHILRVGLLAHQHDFPAALGPFHRSGRREDDLPARAARPRREALRDRLYAFFGRRIDDGMKKLVELVRLDPRDSGFPVDEFFAEHVHRDIQRGRARAFAGPGLEHVEFAVLDRELEVLHVAIMFFEFSADAVELPVEARHRFLERHETPVLIVLGRFVDRRRRADARHHVLALRVDQPFPVKPGIAGGRVAREGHPGGRRVAHVAEDHRLNVGGGPPLVRDAFDVPVGHRAPAVPALEHGADAAPQLLDRVVREGPAENFLDPLLVRLAQSLQILRGQVRVLPVIFSFLQIVQKSVQLLPDTLALLRLDVLGLFHDDVRIHRDEPPVGVVHETLIFRPGDESGDGGRTKTDIEDRLHHAGHRFSRAGPAGHQERIGAAAKLHPDFLLHPLHRLVDFRFQMARELAAARKILGTALGRDRKSRRNRNSDVHHLGEVRAFSAEQILHAGGAFGFLAAKKINKLITHGHLL